MGVTHRFLALEDESRSVLDWFRCLTPEPIESHRPDGILFHFAECGPVEDDATKSPLITVVVPKRKRGVLMTCGEVHFLSTPISLYPLISRLNRNFTDWMALQTCVFSRRAGFNSQWDYYLEGSIQNYDSDVMALPEALRALSKGSYFVAHSDNDSQLDSICQQLENRGVEGIEPR